MWTSRLPRRCVDDAPVVRFDPDTNAEAWFLGGERLLTVGPTAVAERARLDEWRASRPPGGGRNRRWLSSATWSTVVLAYRFGRKHIDVNAVAPGVTRTRPPSA